MVHIAKWPESGVLDKEWAQLSKVVPEGVRIKLTPDPLRRNEVAACCGSWHEYLTIVILLCTFTRAYRRLKKRLKRPRIDQCLKEARKEYRDHQMSKPPKERPAIMWG